ncbi:MAG: YncE family protein, partial [Anaerolineae bacterium]|nr:YncE family protein [Anaerolineae bacterium]
MKDVQSMWPGRWRRTAWMAGAILLAVTVVALLLVILPPPATAANGSLSDPVPRVSQGRSVPGGKIYAPGDLAYVTLSSDDLVALVDTATHAVAGTVDVGAAGCDFPWRAAMTPGGDQVWISCDSSGTVAVIDTTTNSVIHTVTGIPYADGIAFTRDGAYALVGSRNYSQIAIVNTDNYLPSYLSTPAVPRSVATHPFLDRAYATGTDGTLRVIDLTTFEIVATIPVGGDPWDVAVSTDGQWVLAGDRWGSGLVVVDANTNTLHTTVTGLGSVTGLEVAPDGSQIYACSLYAGVRIVDGASFGLLATVDTTGESWEAAVTCDGMELFVGDANGLVP